MSTASCSDEIYISNYIAVHMFVQNKRGETLVLQRSQTNRYKPLFWDIPGGKMLMDEDVVETARRELYEETGLELDDLGFPLSVYVNREQLPHRKDVQIVFTCTIKDIDKAITISQREHCAYRWVIPSELPTLKCMPYLVHFYNQRMVNS